MKSVINSAVRIGRVVELVDTPVLGTGLARGVGSNPISPTNSRKSVYVSVYDTTTLSTIEKMKGVVYYMVLNLFNKERKFGSLRKNHTFHLNNTSDYYSLIISVLINNNSSTPVWWSSRRFS